MTATVVQILAGTSSTGITLAALSGTTGSASNPYTPTFVAGNIATITVDGLAGDWVYTDGLGYSGIIRDLVSDGTIVELGNVPSTEEIATRLLVTPENKLATSADGRVTTTLTATALADEIIPRLAGITITINSPSFSGATGSDLDVEQGDDYATRPARIDIVSAEDLTEYKYVLAARLPSNADAGLALEMTIQEDEVGQYALFAPTAEQTESWSIGTYELRHRIKIAANKYHTVKRGRLNVTPFDTPANAVDVDPPANAVDVDPPA
ncbi:hypothetical protein [Neorhodopirellula pilleata]|uniref:Uncharacterized protein n=1 Tax=Neorhodopirellula pilleata TaxID=2714738 RepID=A0A5C5ZVV4_9BACT|nr:hypothetical protein [Neorhodopirellula pilleata]TWT91400.1 hypothetical protein Pla100_52500 [Neorhodopirellula pilleata]TWT91449.1 hypothetical protein Pla100_52990 [Neorhodopirellula pilleata]